jgi:hypothetical protein
MNPHISDHSLLTVIPLAWKRTKKQHYIARLVTRTGNGEEWRVYVVKASTGREEYLMSEGWKWVNENAVSEFNP